MRVVAQTVKNLLAMQETLGQEDPLEEGMGAHSVCLPGESHGQRSLGGLVRGIAESDTAAQPALSLSPGKYPEQRFYNILPYPICTQVFPILSKMFLFYFLIVG